MLQDFECDPKLRSGVRHLLEEMSSSATLTQGENRAVTSVLQVLAKEEEVCVTKVQLAVLLQPPASTTSDNFDTLSALDIAEQLTYLDHQIFVAIRSECVSRCPLLCDVIVTCCFVFRELLGQSWMKDNKEAKAPNVLLVSKRFNEVCEDFPGKFPSIGVGRM